MCITVRRLESLQPESRRGDCQDCAVGIDALKVFNGQRCGDASVPIPCYEDGYATSLIVAGI